MCGSTLELVDIHSEKKHKHMYSTYTSTDKMYMYILCTHEKLMLSVFNVSGRGVFFTCALLIMLQHYMQDQ